MITVIAFHEREWLETKRLERRLWKQTLSAFLVDEFYLVKDRNEFEQRLGSCKGTPVFLIPDGGDSLDNFQHPDDVIYILGSARESLKKYIKNNMKLTIETPQKTDMFGCVAIAPVLYSRYLQHDS